MGSFEAPYLIIPIDKADPNRVIDNGYTAQLSPAWSTVFVFDVNPAFKDRTCDLMFFVPPASPSNQIAPAHIQSPGGIGVSRLNNGPASARISTSAVGGTAPVGSVPSVQFGNQYRIGTMPCNGGERVGYQLDSVGGLVMDFFQMTSPALGLFMVPV